MRKNPKTGFQARISAEIGFIDMSVCLKRCMNVFTVLFTVNIIMKRVTVFIDTPSE